jgi:hypothetical protein
MSEQDLRLAISDATILYNEMRERVAAGLAASYNARDRWAIVQARITELNNYIASNDPPRLEDLPPPPVLTLDEAALRAHYEGWDEDELPVISTESPARSIECLFMDLEQFVQGDGAVVIYPLIHEDEADGVLLCYAKDFIHATLGGWAMDWNEIAPREALDNNLTVDQILSTMLNIVFYTNQIIERGASI